MNRFSSLVSLSVLFTSFSSAFTFISIYFYFLFFISKAYLAEDIRRELGLHREELVALAYFLGCDYTEGVTGVGIVNALEIVQAFPMRKQDSALEKSKSGKNEKNEKNIKNGKSDCTHGDDNGSAEGSDIENGPYPIVGLKKFKEWLEGYDFAETINSKRKISTNVKTTATAKSKGKSGKSVSKKDKMNGDEKEEGGEEGKGDRECKDKGEDMPNKNIRRRKASRKFKNSFDNSSESEHSCTDSGSDSRCSDESSTKSVTHALRRNSSKSKGKKSAKKNNVKLLKLSKNSEKEQGGELAVDDGDVDKVQIIQDDEEEKEEVEEEEEENEVENNEKLLPDLSTRLVGIVFVFVFVFYGVLCHFEYDSPPW